MLHFCLYIATRAVSAIAVLSCSAFFLLFDYCEPRVHVYWNLFYLSTFYSFFSEESWLLFLIFLILFLVTFPFVSWQ
jgi:hypothetical protein